MPQRDLRTSQKCETCILPLIAQYLTRAAAIGDARKSNEIGADPVKVRYRRAMSTIKKGLVTASGEWRKHLRWLKRAFWKTERQGVKAATRRDASAE